MDDPIETTKDAVLGFFYTLWFVINPWGTKRTMSRKGELLSANAFIVIVGIVLGFWSANVPLTPVGLVGLLIDRAGDLSALAYLDYVLRLFLVALACSWLTRVVLRLDEPARRDLSELSKYVTGFFCAGALLVLSAFHELLSCRDPDTSTILTAEYILYSQLLRVVIFAYFGYLVIVFVVHGVRIVRESGKPPTRFRARLMSAAIAIVALNAWLFFDLSSGLQESGQSGGGNGTRASFICDWIE